MIKAFVDLENYEEIILLIRDENELNELKAEINLKLPYVKEFISDKGRIVLSNEIVSINRVDYPNENLELYKTAFINTINKYWKAIPNNVRRLMAYEINRIFPKGHYERVEDEGDEE